MQSECSNWLWRTFRLIMYGMTGFNGYGVEETEISMNLGVNSSKDRSFTDLSEVEICC